MKKKKSETNSFEDLNHLIAEFFGEVFVPEKKESAEDYLHRADRISTLMRNVIRREVAEKGSFLEMVIRSLSRRNPDRADTGKFCSMLRKTAAEYLNAVLDAMLKGEDGSLAWFKKLTGLNVNSCKAEEIPGNFAKQLFSGEKRKVLLLEKDVFFKGHDEYHLMLVQGKVSKAYLRSSFLLPVNGMGELRIRAFGIDAIANMVLFHAVMEIMENDPVKAEFLKHFAVEAAQNHADESLLETVYLNGCVLDPASFWSDSKSVDEFLTSAYCYLIMEYITDRQYERYHKTIGHSARVFETKKNIPDHVLRAMQVSRFNEFFGYVEFDELTMLEDAVEVYKDFSAINARLFHGLKTPDVQIRFRLLGRHHAAGLYFPMLRCICIDLRSPSSFVHEYFHMYDYLNGELSAMYEFFGIRECYSRLLWDWYSRSDDGTRKIMKKSKYGIRYYLTPTEIFARCGEIFVARICGVRNSCINLKDENLFAYPKDKELEKLVSEYYGRLLNFKQEKEESGAAATA